jgi:6-phosphofructokinase 2
LSDPDTPAGAPIVTLTLNPTIDGSSEAGEVRPMSKVRTSNEHYDPGGGGINVARAVRELGGEALALALAGGATGILLEDLLKREKVAHRLVPIAGHTRISLAVYERSSGLEYRFVPSGPTLSPPEIDACLAAVEETDYDIFVASGSLPNGAPSDLLVQVGRIVADKGARFVLDSSGEGLKATLGRVPIHLFKPSLSELRTVAERDLPEASDQDEAVAELVRSGAAEIVALTLGPKGGVLGTADGVARMAAPEVETRSAVGAGDSFVAGMTYHLWLGRSPSEAFCWGMAAGAAAVLTPGTGLCRREDVERLYATFAECPQPG